MDAICAVLVTSFTKSWPRFGGPNREMFPPPQLPPLQSEVDAFERPSLQALGWPKVRGSLQVVMQWFCQNNPCCESLGERFGAILVI